MAFLREYWRRVNNPSLGLLLLRIIVGIVGVFHGSQKLFGWFKGDGIANFATTLEGIGVPLATLSAILAGCAEFFGGILILLGVFTRLAAVPFLITMLVAITAVHWGRFAAQSGGMEYPLTLAMILLTLIFTGPGRYALFDPLEDLPPEPRPVTRSAETQALSSSEDRGGAVRGV
jgi:putative oxidoreductase